MENQFTVNKRERYFNLIYLGYKPTSTKLNVWYPDNTYCLDRKDTEKLINTILKLESAMTERMKELGLNHNPKKIIRMSFNHLQDILIGIDIRAKWPFEKKVDLYVNRFNEKYEEAKRYCNTLLETVKECDVYEDENWELIEEYDRFNDIYELGFEDIHPYLKESVFKQVFKNIDDAELKFKLLTEKFNKINIW